MKRIQKNQEPQSFADWKATNAHLQPTYTNDLQNPEKSDVHASLLDEQGDICCYCGRRIDANSSHIEHLIPQSADPSKDLDYNNLLASCFRFQERKEPLHCGPARTNQSLPITPLQADCETRFRFTNDGQIKPAKSEDTDASDTVKLLSLDIYKLQDLRKKAIRRAFFGIEFLDPHEKTRMQNAFEQRDAQRRFAEFCVPILYVLDNYF